MGLDVSHDCWHGPYSAFMRFRMKLSEVAGYGDLLRREGFAGIRPPLELRPVMGEGEQAPIPWPSPEDDPLVILMCHSDCDGEIAPEWCDRIADCLEQLMPAMRRADGVCVRGWSFAEATQAWIDGLRWAAEEKEVVTFG